MYAHSSFLRGRPELLSQLKKNPNARDKNSTKSTTMNEKNIQRQTKVNTATSSLGMNVRTVSACSSREELHRSTLPVHRQENSYESQNYQQNFNAPLEITENKHNCHDPGIESPQYKPIAVRSIDTPLISASAKANGKLALLAIVMSCLVERDPRADPQGTFPNYGVPNFH